MDNFWSLFYFTPPMVRVFILFNLLLWLYIVDVQKKEEKKHQNLQYLTLAFLFVVLLRLFLLPGPGSILFLQTVKKKCKPNNFNAS